MVVPLVMGASGSERCLQHLLMHKKSDVFNYTFFHVEMFPLLSAEEGGREGGRGGSQPPPPPRRGLGRYVAGDAAS